MTHYATSPPTAKPLSKPFATSPKAAPHGNLAPTTTPTVETVRQAAAGDTTAQADIVHYSRRLIRRAAYHAIAGYERADLEQEAAIVFAYTGPQAFVACNGKDFDHFLAIAYQHAKWRMASIRKHNTAKKRRLLADAIALGDGPGELDSLARHAQTPLAIAIGQEIIEQLAGRMFDNTPDQRARMAAILRAAGLSSGEADEVLRTLGVIGPARFTPYAMNRLATRLGLTTRGPNGQRRVEQRTSKGERLRCFNSLMLAAEGSGVPMPQISAAANGHRKSAGGYAWRFLDGK